MSHLYLPGRGMVNLDARRVDRAVQEYDERLFFSRHPQTGQWTVFIKIERDLPDEFGTVVSGTRAFPVLAFNDIPEPSEATRRLYESDAIRHGTRILDKIHENNERVREPLRRKAEEAQEQLAEVVESYMHDQGETRYRRVLRPMKKTAVRGH